MKIKGLIIGSLVFTLISSAHAQQQSEPFTQTCSQNPDLFLTINNGLTNNVVITRVQSFLQVNGVNAPQNLILPEIPSNNNAIVSGFANSACLQTNGVFSVGVGITMLTTIVQSVAGVPISNLIASSQPTPGIGLATPGAPIPVSNPSITTAHNAITQTNSTQPVSLTVNCVIATNQIQAGTLIKTIRFDQTTNTYFCN